MALSAMGSDRRSCRLTDASASASTVGADGGPMAAEKKAAPRGCARSEARRGGHPQAARIRDARALGRHRRRAPRAADKIRATLDDIAYKRGARFTWEANHTARALVGLMANPARAARRCGVARARRARSARRRVGGPRDSGSRLDRHRARRRQRRARSAGKPRAPRAARAGQPA